jgi:hypothetical protein
MPPHGHGNDNWAVEPSLANAVRNGGFWESLPMFHNQWSISTGVPLTGTLASGLPILTAVSATQAIKWPCDTGTTGVTTTGFYTFRIPDTFAQEEAKLRVRLLVLGSLATITSITCTPTLLTWTQGAAVKTAVASTATKRWAALGSETGLEAQAAALGTPTATGTTTFLSATMTTPNLVEIDFTPGATTARTNYPKAGDAATFKLVCVANTADATDNLTILAGAIQYCRHAALYRGTDRT